MKWLTLDGIKAHSRIDFDCEDDLLELYAESAEDTILSICNRSLDDLKMIGGGAVPKSVVHATLMLVDVSYTHRSPVSPQSMACVPYTFDTLIKPYMRLTPIQED